MNMHESSDILDDAMQTDTIKHVIDGVSSAAAFGSLMAWMNAELPLLIMWATFIATMMSIFWWIYRFYSEIRKHFKKAHHGTK